MLLEGAPKNRIFETFGECSLGVTQGTLLDSSFETLNRPARETVLPVKMSGVGDSIWYLRANCLRLAVSTDLTT